MMVLGSNRGGFSFSRGPLGGPLLGLLGFLVMPAVWSVPEALVAAELATAFPSNGGYVTWVTVTWRLTKGVFENGETLP